MNSVNNIIKPISESLAFRAAQVTNELLPDKSRLRYELVYKKFGEWCSQENVQPKQVTDDVMLVYLSEKSKQVKPSTLWSMFSMLKKMLEVKENIDASKYLKTIAFLKKQSVGFKPKKSNVFTADQITQFMVKAPDSVWLLSKVILTFGIFGACRRDDLLHLRVTDVKDCGNFFTVFVRDGKTPLSRSFTITNDECSYQPCQLLRKYLSLRPSHMKSDRLFVAYRNEKCVAQHVGMHKIAGIPKSVAKYLNLEHPKTYTGHAMRRSSASMLVEGGADLLTLKRHGGWKSATVAESYVEDSLSRKIDVSKKLFSQVANRAPSQSTVQHFKIKKWKVTKKMKTNLLMTTFSQLMIFFQLIKKERKTSKLAKTNSLQLLQTLFKTTFKIRLEVKYQTKA